MSSVIHLVITNSFKSTFFVEHRETPKEKLPVPKAIVSMFDGRLYHPKPNNDPASHQGRTRLFEHERGNWATYIYVPCKL